MLMKEVVCASYNVRSSRCAFMNEALLWHADCSGTRLQKLCCGCAPYAPKGLGLYAALYMLLFGPPEQENASAQGAI